MGVMPYKEILSAVAIALTFAAFVPYIRTIISGATKPHVFSWIIWGATTFVVFLAQIEDKGGVGAWPIGVSGCITVFVAFLAYVKRADITITKTDWLFFTLAMSSLPLWYFSSDPLWAVVVLTTVDVLGFGPTFRKAYSFPHSESLLFFSLFVVRNILVMMALENYSITTVLFPAAVAVACMLLMAMIMYRRRAATTLAGGT
ncbi:hypothetical protein [Methylobacter marinus]|uniref:hypothetical protein n=1 Tax=Methylobacter marinus TaxID=34058 RepID=UPI00037998C0|nr:hypothetical protein [Methylobacter marinus]